MNIFIRILGFSFGIGLIIWGLSTIQVGNAFYFRRTVFHKEEATAQRRESPLLFWLIVVVRILVGVILLYAALTNQIRIL
ncbi:MAG: hypothetical protein GY797_30270 [Deltaproteobacteria bacterium]|nr:hypothetical protein [Deltaproteobacteria bacterium]